MKLLLSSFFVFALILSWNQNSFAERESHGEFPYINTSVRYLNAGRDELVAKAVIESGKGLAALVSTLPQKVDYAEMLRMIRDVKMKPSEEGPLGEALPGMVLAREAFCEMDSVTGLNTITVYKRFFDKYDKAKIEPFEFRDIQRVLFKEALHCFGYLDDTEANRLAVGLMKAHRYLTAHREAIRDYWSQTQIRNNFCFDLPGKSQQCFDVAGALTQQRFPQGGAWTARALELTNLDESMIRGIWRDESTRKNWLIQYRNAYSVYKNKFPSGWSYYYPAHKFCNHSTQSATQFVEEAGFGSSYFRLPTASELKEANAKGFFNLKPVWGGHSHYENAPPSTYFWAAPAPGKKRGSIVNIADGTVNENPDSDALAWMVCVSDAE